MGLIRTVVFLIKQTIEMKSWWVKINVWIFIDIFEGVSYIKNQFYFEIFRFYYKKYKTIFHMKMKMNFKNKINESVKNYSNWSLSESLSDSEKQFTHVKILSLVRTQSTWALRQHWMQTLKRWYFNKMSMQTQQTWFGIVEVLARVEGFLRL